MHEASQDWVDEDYDTKLVLGAGKWAVVGAGES